MPEPVASFVDLRGRTWTYAYNYGTELEPTYFYTESTGHYLPDTDIDFWFGIVAE